ncbi:hypothetical protein A2U01_0051242, partial [Trifolium medium]|nr:hypothetical protein [Trifolium medium]
MMEEIDGVQIQSQIQIQIRNRKLKKVMGRGLGNPEFGRE